MQLSLSHMFQSTASRCIKSNLHKIVALCFVHKRMDICLYLSTYKIWSCECPSTNWNVSDHEELEFYSHFLLSFQYIIIILRITKVEPICSVGIVFFLIFAPWKVKVPLEVQEIYRNILGRKSYSQEKINITFRWWCSYVSALRNNTFIVSSVVSHFPYLSLMSGCFFHSLNCNLLFSSVNFWR